MPYAKHELQIFGYMVLPIYWAYCNLLDGKKNIDMVRLHDSQYPYEDVDTLLLGLKVRVVEGG